MHALGTQVGLVALVDDEESLDRSSADIVQHLVDIRQSRAGRLAGLDGSLECLDSIVVDIKQQLALVGIVRRMDKFTYHSIVLATAGRTSVRRIGGTGCQQRSSQCNT